MKPRRVLAHLSGSGLVASIGATGTSQIVQLLIQLATVPVLAHSWGLGAYGSWLILFTLPAYLAAGDFGFIGAAANDMSHAVAQDRLDDARHTYSTMRVALGAIIAVLLPVFAALAFGPERALLDFAEPAASGHAAMVVTLLGAYGLVGLYNQLAAAGLRAAGHYAQGVYRVSLIALAEAGLALAVAGAGGGMVAVAATYLAVRLAGTLSLSLLLGRLAPWLGEWGWRISLAELRRLAKPAAAMAVLPAAMAISLQGMVVVVGAAAGAAAVPAFTATRTLTRVAVQVVGIVNHASMPDFTVACAKGQTERKADLAALTVITSLLVLIPAAFAVVALGQPLILLWTGGLIHAGTGLIVAMTLVMVCHGTWRALGNLILAMNEHHRFSYHFLALSLLAMPLGYFLARQMGAAGGGYALAMADAGLLAIVTRHAIALGIVTPHSLHHAPARVITMMRRAVQRMTD